MDGFLIPILWNWVNTRTHDLEDLISDLSGCGVVARKEMFSLCYSVILAGFELFETPTGLSFRLMHSRPYRSVECLLLEGLELRGKLSHSEALSEASHQFEHPFE
jgi:hypothetical protein